MSVVGRIISNRSPYNRASLVFDRSCKRNGAGEPVIEVTLEDCERLGQDNMRQLLQDPAIRFESIGPHSEVLLEAVAAVASGKSIAEDEAGPVIEPVAPPRREADETAPVKGAAHKAKPAKAKTSGRQ